MISNNVVRDTLPTERKFGLFVALVCLVIGGYLIYSSHLTFAGASVLVAFVFALAAFMAPNLLRPLNKAWFNLGMLLGVIVSPIMLGAMFFLLITPVALVTRLFGRDALKLRRRQVPSYWVIRDPAGPEPASFKMQF